MIKCQLYKLLHENHVKISDISEATGISRTTLCALNWDKGKGVQFNTLDKLCRYFNCNISDLLVYEEEKENVSLEARLNEQSTTTGKA